MELPKWRCTHTASLAEHLRSETSYRSARTVVEHANTLQPRLDGCLCEQHRRWASLNVPTPSHGLHAMHSLERQIFSLPVKPQRVQEANPEVAWPSSSRPGPTSGVLVHSKFVMAVVDVFSCPERFYLFDEMLATSHSMPEESPSPVLAEHGLDVPHTVPDVVQTQRVRHLVRRPKRSTGPACWRKAAAEHPPASPPVPGIVALTPVSPGHRKRHQINHQKHQCSNKRSFLAKKPPAQASPLS